MKVGDLIRISDEGAMNIDEIGVDTGTVGIIVKVEPPVYASRGMSEMYTVILTANHMRVPCLFDCEIEKF